jgi:hypothetical protein
LASGFDRYLRINLRFDIDRITTTFVVDNLKLDRRLTNFLVTPDYVVRFQYRLAGCLRLVEITEFDVLALKIGLELMELW